MSLKDRMVKQRDEGVEDARPGQSSLEELRPLGSNAIELLFGQVTHARLSLLVRLVLPRSSWTIERPVRLRLKLGKDVVDGRSCLGARLVTLREDFGRDFGVRGGRTRLRAAVAGCGRDDLLEPAFTAAAGEPARKATKVLPTRTDPGEDITVLGVSFVDDAGAIDCEDPQQSASATQDQVAVFVERTESLEGVHLVDGLFGLLLEEAQSPTQDQEREARDPRQLGEQDCLVRERIARRLGATHQGAQGGKEGQRRRREGRKQVFEPFFSALRVPCPVDGREVEIHIAEREQLRRVGRGRILEIRQENNKVDTARGGFTAFIVRGESSSSRGVERTYRRQVSTLIHSFHARCSSSPSMPARGGATGVDLTFAGKSSERNMKMSAEWNECDSKRSVHSIILG